jgi:signal transduction histidine kinase
MLLSNTAKEAEKLPRGMKTLRRRYEDAANRDPVLPAGLPCCSNCGLPMPDIYKALQREQRLVGRLLEEHEAFKQSLSDEIYEGFNQQLVGAILHLQGFEQIERESPAEAREIFRAGLELLRDTLDEARRIANRLKPPVLDDFGLTEGVNYLLYEMRRFGGREIEFLQSGDLDDIPSRTKSDAFRILQELLRNVGIHSGSQKVRLQMTRTARFLRVKIEDWGAGFDPAKVSADYFELRKIRERARLLGGRAVVHGAPGKAARIVVELPIAKPVCK